METLLDLTAQMAREGIRRLLVLSGDEHWCLAQAVELRERLGGDSLWVGALARQEPYVASGALKTLLGREFLHAFFDAHHGFDVAAFAALGGTLRAGSWLVLLAPDFARWPEQVDGDSLRWSDTSEPIATPNFVHRCLQLFSADPEVALWRQGDCLRLPEAAPRRHWHAADGYPQAEQAAILSSLLSSPPEIAAVTAGRGRGKSALAGMLIHQLAGSAIITAPTRDATAVIAAFAGEKMRFMAPDALLASDAKADWLVVDEAAAIPAPTLRQLTTRFPHTLLTTTVQGYEGTGRGFLLKFCAGFPTLRRYNLSSPIRWAPGCPLESVIDRLLLFNDEAFLHVPHGEPQLETLSQDAWREQPTRPSEAYQLLSGAHYRTSPLDLRRMMDAPGQHFTVARCGDSVAGAVWLVEEGGLEPELSRAVWAGYRRPRGNLVAQSLAAHGGSPLAATLTGRRVSRIAVHPARQREGLGQRLIAHAVKQTHGCDYLSVSFGYTPELWRFWQRCGFLLVRMGTHREASSGCYTAMALYPLSAAGQQLAWREHQRLARDERWLSQWRDERAPVTAEETAMLTEEDWLEIAGFAFAHRPLLTAVGSLNRLLQATPLPLVALRARLAQHDEAALCADLGLSGRKALLGRLREEAAAALSGLDPARAQRLDEWVRKLQFF